MIELPNKLFFRRGEVLDIFGFSEQGLTKLIRSGTLTPVFLAGNKRAYFARQNLAALLPKQRIASPAEVIPPTHPVSVISASKNNQPKKVL